MNDREILLWVITFIILIWGGIIFTKKMFPKDLNAKPEVDRRQVIQDNQLKLLEQTMKACGGEKMLLEYKAVQRDSFVYTPEFKCQPQ